MADIFTAAYYAGELNPSPHHNKVTPAQSAVLTVKMECEHDPSCALDHAEAVERVAANMPGVTAVTIDWQ